MLLERETGSGKVIGIGVDRLIVDLELSRQLGFGNVKGIRRVNFADVAGLHRKLQILNFAERSLQPAGGEDQLGLNFPWLVAPEVTTNLCYVNGTFVPCCEKQRLLWKGDPSG